MIACWVCKPLTPSGAKPTPGGVCDDCRAVLAAEQACCSSDAACREKAGHGRWGQFCAEHAAEIADVRERWFAKNGTVLKAERKPDAPEPETPDFIPAAPAQPKRDEMAAKIADAVRASEGALTAKVIAQRLNVDPKNGTFRRALHHARDQSVIALENGKGWTAPSLAGSSA